MARWPRVNPLPMEIPAWQARCMEATQSWVEKMVSVKAAAIESKNSLKLIQDLRDPPRRWSILSEVGKSESVKGGGKVGRVERVWLL